MTTFSVQCSKYFRYLIIKLEYLLSHFRCVRLFRTRYNAHQSRLHEKGLQHV